MKVWRSSHSTWRAFLFLLLLTTVVGLAQIASTTSASDKLQDKRSASPSLDPSSLFVTTQIGKVAPEVLADTTAGSTAPVVIMLADQADVSAASEIKDQDERGWFVYRTLTEHAKRTQSELKRFLTSKGITFQSFWIANMIVADADRQLVDLLSARSDVARIDSNRASRWIEDPKIANSRATPNVPETAEWGVANVNAPQVWALGYTGQGIVIANQDTGMRWTHNALKNKYRGWDGVSANHNYNWHDAIHSQVPGSPVTNPCGRNLVAPCDDHGHGTHTTGTTSGDDGAGHQVGVAPGAKWIGCRNMDVGNGTPSTYAECFQFFIAPTDLNGNNPNPALRPHVMNNSWGCTSGEGCTTRAELETITNNTQAAGIFVVVSAGNSGPSCSTVSTPSAIYDASFTVGSIDINNSLAGSSSRGPSTYYNPNLLKPNISAPGVDVGSSIRTDDSSFGTMGGTSMAAPHVVGVVALLWSARPQLLRQIAATKAILQSTANPNVILSPQTCGGIPSSQIPNNSFGYGRVDALAAVNSLPTISGRLLYRDSLTTGAKNVTMTLTGDNGFVTQVTTTDNNGYYVFTNVPAGNDYTVTPSRAAEVHDASITSFDASLTAQYAVSVISLTSNQVVAADTSNNGSATAFDASQISRYQLGTVVAGSIAGSWKFSPSSFSIPNLTTDQVNSDGAAILVGDVSGNWSPSRPGPLAPEGLPAVEVVLPVKQDPPGGPSIIPISVSDTTGQDILAYTFDVTFNPAVLQPQATPFDTSGTLSSGWVVNANTSTAGHLIINAFNTTAMTGQGVLLKLKFDVVGAGGSTTPLTFASFNFNEGSPNDIDVNGVFTASSPSAAASRVSGRIMTAAGQPVAGATITVLGASRTVRAITDSEGFYRVEGLPSGEFYTVTPSRANFVFAPANQSFSLVADKTDAVFTGEAIGAEQANPLESPEFFVRQQYLDFLGREPEQAGLDFWAGQLRSCGNNADCVRQKRLDVSAAFFIAQEFQDSGLYLYDMYEGALGRRPDFTEYAADRPQVVGGPTLEAEKAAFALSFVDRAEFTTAYPLTMNNEVFVDALLQKAQQTSGLNLESQRAALLSLYESGASVSESRSLVLRKVIEGAAFKQTQYNAGFVLAEYFSYLGRNPEQSGYEFWLNVLNTTDRSNYRGMVCSFVTSAEYQRRFSTVVPRSNGECR